MCGGPIRNHAPRKSQRHQFAHPIQNVARGAGMVCPRAIEVPVLWDWAMNSSPCSWRTPPEALKTEVLVSRTHASPPILTP